MKLSIIVAADEKSGIGKDNKLMWHLPADLKFFKNTTLGHHIIMGRKTYESIGKPLPGRTSIVVTRNKNYQAEGCIIANTLEEAIEKAKQAGETEAFVIGGAELINDATQIADTIYLTEVKAVFDADVYMKPINSSEWDEISREEHRKDEKHAYDYAFVKLVKKSV